MGTYDDSAVNISFGRSRETISNEANGFVFNGELDFSKAS